MAVILSIETTTSVCSIAITTDEGLKGQFNLHVDKAHSSSLHQLIQEMSEHTGISLSSLEAIAISKGPGSYTGLRIGSSTAKGLCYALGIPLIAVNTLEAMAFGVRQFYTDPSYFCPMIDARRMEVYCQVIAGHGATILEVSPQIINENSFAEILFANRVLFFGNGAAKCKSVLGMHPNAIFIDGVTTEAKYIGALANEKFSKKQFEDLAYFQPFYLKEFQTGKPKESI
jgi:tRNA threonylcarbamoyladenosine biosynthesis protein TsaB